MDRAVISSAAFLTVLLSVGLFFFIRASAKDRTQVVRLKAEGSGEQALQTLEQYFIERSYRLTEVDPEQRRVAYEGFVRPSLFLALFLTGLAGAGILCLSLVLSMTITSGATVFPFLAILAPLAGVFYWKKAARIEKVVVTTEENDTLEQSQSVVTVSAHRDELIELQRSLPLVAVD